MSSTKVLLRPGVNTNVTPLLNEAGWSDSQLIRFFNGLIQKIGGWAKYIGVQLFGTCRGLFVWVDLNSQSYVAAGTNNTLEVVFEGGLYDITPQLSTQNLTDPFTTISGTNTLTVHDVAHGELAGDAIYIITETSINGKLLIGYQEVVSVTGVDDYIISTPVTFTASVSGATTALYTTTIGSPIVTVTLANHGRIPGQFYTINVSTTVGGLVLVGTYQVATVTDVNNFTFSAGLNAGSNASGRENGGDIRINYLLHGGLVSATPMVGFGVGLYGIGGYGIGSGAGAPTPLRQWFFGNWGSFLIANFTDGGIYVWDPAGGVTGNPATIIATAPTANSMFISMPQRQVVALEADGDPLLVAWSDVDDYTQWTPSITNQSGSYRLTRGSRIVGGMQGPQQGLIWTDLDLWAMNYIQPPLIYGFNQVGSNCGLISARAMGILGGKVFWMSQNNFFVYDGQVNPLVCTVWDQIFPNFNFPNFNINQVGKITCAVNSMFNEISWFFPSNANGEVDTYVKYNVQDGVWDFGTLCRTAWFDQSVIGPPIGADENSHIQQHEVSFDADGLPMFSSATSGIFKLSDGLMYIFIERMIPDFKLNFGIPINITINTFDYQDQEGAINVLSFDITSETEYIIVRARGRFASITISSDQLGSDWRLGELLYFGSAVGRR